VRLAVLTVVLLLAVPATAQDPAIHLVPGTCLAIVPSGAPSGGDAIYCNQGTFIGLRDLQGGGPGGEPFDIGAGSTEDPSDLSVNWDIGRAFKVFQGTKALRFRCANEGCGLYFGAAGQERLIAFFGKRITFYVKPRVRRAHP